MTQTLTALTALSTDKSDAQALTDYARVMLMIARHRETGSVLRTVSTETESTTAETVCAKGSN